MYLEAYLKYDWEAFNRLGSTDQCGEWNRLKNGFHILIKKEYISDKFDFEKVYALIRSYTVKFEKLPIEGKRYVIVNKRLGIGQLIEIVKEIEYQEAKKMKKIHCECQLLSKFKRSPNSKNLKEVGVINDSYYLPKIYRCTTCGYKWIAYVSDDSTGNIIYEEFNPEDTKDVTYYE